MIRWFIPGFFLTLALGVVFLLARNGAFMPVEVRVSERGMAATIEVENIGPYHKVVASMEKVEAWARENGYGCELSFGRYIDDPDVVEPERLRSQVGCVFATAPQPANPLPEGFSAGVIPSGKYVVGLFRGSPALGPYKVYGKAADVMREQNLTQIGPITEIYRVISPTEVETQYLFPVK